jgi:hypothetical protein
MKSFAKALLLAAVVSFTAASATAADGPKSVALVRAMRTDEIAVANAKLAFLGGNLTERFGKTSNGCIKRVSYTEFTAGWARVVDGFLSPPEIDKALAFYQSEAGVKYVEGLLRRMRERQGKESQLPEVSGKEEISPAELAKISEFSSSDIGRKLGKDFQQAPAALAWGNDMTAQIARKCGGK